MDLAEFKKVASGAHLSAYARSAMRRIGRCDISELDITDLWNIHSEAVSGSHKSSLGVSLLDLKIELAQRMMHECSLCERRCGANRSDGETGFCGVGADSHYFFEQILWGEESPLIPSHEIFFSGCNMRCKFCYSWESLDNPYYGQPCVPEALARTVDARRKEGASNVNLLGGEPTVHLHTILKTLRHISSPTAVVWNSNFFMSQECVRLLEGVVDLYVGDLRFGNDQCALSMANTEGYFAAACRNFETVAKSGDLIIRHLLLPGHVDCCLRPIAEWVSAHLPDVPFNLMFQYTPCYQALNDPGMSRSVTPEEERDALDIVSSLGLNTDRWNNNSGAAHVSEIDSKESISTTITIRPDGKVGIMHLHGELLDLVESLKSGGIDNG